MVNPWHRYVAYLKNNPEHYWFRRKLWGWGWTPATREGWITLAVFMAVFVWILVPFANDPTPTNDEVFGFLFEVVTWMLLLVAICWKTGEPPKWQWGIPDEDKDT